MTGNSAPMESAQSLEPLVDGAIGLGLSLQPSQLDLFARYQALLIDWNRRLNLTAVSDPVEIQRRHFLDSLSCALVTGNLNGSRLVDVGSGAGFPGLPLKILYPGLELTLVESIGKKAGFLKGVVAELGLSGVLVEGQRAEELAHRREHRGRYDWAVARAVAGLPVLAEYLLPFCRVGGRAIAMKGKQAAEEIDGALAAVEILGGHRPTLRSIRLPGTDRTHTLVVITKAAETPLSYPRRPGIPSKRPLK